MNRLPSKIESYYIVEMLESSLINYRLTIPWADNLITKIDNVPSWLFDVSTKKYQSDQIRAFRTYAYGEPFERTPEDVEQFHVACLWHRYERRELSWATLLQQIGYYLDAYGGKWHCETPYHYLNLFEEAGFTVKSEEETKRAYLKDQNVKDHLYVVNDKLKWFD